jgi:hypothetical protein
METIPMLMRTLAPIGLAFGLATTTAAWANEPAKKTGAASTKPAAAPASTERGRDWSKIDTNRDNLISPEEMEAWLAANPGPAKK